MALRDIDFLRFAWHVRPDADLAVVDNRESFRGLVNRWLLTNPSEPLDGLVDEEVEARRKYSSEAARAARYHHPEGSAMLACIPWDPTFGAGIKKYLNQPVTPAIIAELRTRIFSGLSRLQGVTRVLDVAVSSLGSRVTVHWRVLAHEAIVEDNLQLPRELGS